MIRGQLPEVMKPDERLTEIAELLGVAYRRMQARHMSGASDLVDSHGPLGAPCNQLVNGHGVADREDVA